MSATAMHRNINWFDKTTSQMQAPSLVAFGVLIESRGGKVSEVVEMLRFVEACARRGLETHLARLVYDSQSCFCSFEFAGDGDEQDELDTRREILTIALRTITRFEWSDGYLYQGLSAVAGR